MQKTVCPVAAGVNVKLGPITSSSSYVRQSYGQEGKKEGRSYGMTQL